MSLILAKAARHCPLLRAGIAAVTEARAGPRLEALYGASVISAMKPADAVPTDPEQGNGDRTEEEHSLQLKSPAARLAEREDLLHVGQAEGEEHVADHEYGADAREQAEDDQDGPHDFTQICAVGQKRRQTMAAQHSGYAIYAVEQLGYAV